MLFKEIKHDFEIEGTKCSFETGKLALKSESSILARMGDTVITVNVNSNPATGEFDYFPLSVEYIEKFYASGKISGSRFVKRERYPTDDAVLKARMIDRSIRPLFPEDYKDEVSVIVTVMSYDEENDPLILAMNTVSVALMNSKSPFEGPIGGVRVGMNEDGSLKQILKSMDLTSETDKMNYVVSGYDDKFTMIDAGSYEVEEEKIIEAMDESFSYIKSWTDAQKEFLAKLEKKDKAYVSVKTPVEVVDAVREFLGEERILENLQKADSDVHNATKAEVFEKFEGKYSKSNMESAYDLLLKKALRKLVLEEDVRSDGRKMDEVREIYTELDLLPRVHGSALFTRGVTQTLTVATLGSLKDVRLVDDMLGDREQRYMHFYNDLPFAYGDAKRVRLIPSRRAVGHGMLAEKGLWPVIPSEEEFPYTMLVMSEIQGENGSSSMASACGSTMALMAAGVPIRKPVAGIACGLVAQDEQFKVLTDMQGVEDFYGHMDFKVIGTKDGVTAVQMDTKTKGLTMDIVKETFKKSKEARLMILDKMSETISEPNEGMSKYAPRVVQVKVPQDKIGEIIGPGGKNIREISESSGAEIEIEEDGTVNIYSSSEESIEAAKKLVSGYDFQPEVGKIYEGKVASIMDYGAFVDLAPGVAGLLHVSEIADEFVKDVRKYVNEGDIIKVKVIGVDGQGKIKLSIKGLEEEN